ncbi:MAG: type II CAAX endopeptidase family protein [Paludisphaera borealis]|uniref:CPBP family intramembrane glutamic endopeptidase n=1 Tax=Paludisphaera borealis TaxID=1387353 RepID=UPI002850D3EC|nr:type II CAAX endopeptidase family protein [Paludisphaera borealis]MDR3618585.1 type II CAAX endopeptidase family protein [Paludisphaera borealis]
MRTTIGGRLNDSRLRSVVAGLVAGAVVLADFWLVHRGEANLWRMRAAPPFLALAVYLILARGDRASVGLTLRPIQGLRYWSIATLVIGAAIGAIILLAGASAWLLGLEVPSPSIRPEDAPERLISMCVMAPVVEEATYRLGFCAGAVPVLKPWGTIALSGVVFGLLHVQYGNPAPDNLVAGFFLGWAFFKSGSILVPVALHSLGNLCVLALWLGSWYWRHGLG